MNTLIETNQKRKSNSSLFDKIWYEKRYLINQASVPEGFVFDGQGMVASSSVFKNANKQTEEPRRKDHANNNGSLIAAPLNIIMEENEDKRSNKG